MRAFTGVTFAASAAILCSAILCSGSASSRTALPNFDHVLVVVLENKSQSNLLGNEDAPNFNGLAKRYAVLSHYGGVTHPSLPNYLALVSGSTHGIRSDCTRCVVSGRSLADSLERAHLSWKVYAEGLPRPGFTGCCAGRYAKKHVPFLYFKNVLAKVSRLRHVVPLRQLSRDLAAARLPTFSLVIPDLCHDMHDCPVGVGDAWLGDFLKPLLRSQQLANSAIFVITDEPPHDVRPEMPVPALALGHVVLPGSNYSPTTSHYGLLRTIEDTWGLPRLGHSAQAKPITGIWR